MKTEHPITPSEDQIMLWCKQWNCTKEPGPIHKWLAIQAARWGADTELDACCEWLRQDPATHDLVGREARYLDFDLRAHRRPKPPSLKDQALAQLDSLHADLKMHGLGTNTNTIRRALEALPDV